MTSQVGPYGVRVTIFTASTAITAFNSAVGMSLDSTTVEWSKGPSIPREKHLCPVMLAQLNVRTRPVVSHVKEAAVPVRTAKSVSIPEVVMPLCVRVKNVGPTH